MLYRPPLPLGQPKPRTSRLPAALAGLLIVVVLAGAGYWWKQRSGTAAAPSTTPSDQTAAATPATPAPAPVPQTLPEFAPAFAVAPRLPPHCEVLLGPSTRGMVVDLDRQVVLWERDADTPVAVASLTKLMAVTVALELMGRNPALSMATPVPVSRTAMATGGTQLWLEAGASYPLGQLLEAMMIQSANDAAVAVAEFLSPDTSAAGFVALMNRRARELGLRRARFYSPHGLPGESAEKDNQVTVRELARLAVHVRQFPEARAWAATRRAEFTHQNGKKLSLDNHNRLLGQVAGVNGLKTGYTARAGFCMVTTCERQGRTLVAVVTGSGRREDRDKLVTGLFDWGFAQPTALAVAAGR